jgi:hypothetical protein
MFSVKQAKKLLKANSPFQGSLCFQGRQGMDLRQFRRQCHWCSAASRRHYLYRLLKPEEKLSHLHRLFPLLNHIQHKRRLCSR